MAGARPKWEREGRHWPNRANSTFVEAAGLRWHVQTFGPDAPTHPVLPGPQKPPPHCLLLHGTGAATHSWRDFAPHLAPHFSVLAPDLPGHGFTGSPGAPRLSIPHMGRHLRGLLDETGFAPDLVIGHSAGAAIAIAMALAGHIQPRLIVALNGALLPFPGMAARLFPAMAKVLFLNPITPQVFAWQASDRRRVERLMESTGSNIDAEGLSHYADLFSCPGHVAGALGMMANWDLETLASNLVRLDVPLVQIVGAEDGTIPPRNAQTVAKKVRRGRVVVLERLGHLAHEEAPEAVGREVEKAWMETTGAPLGQIAPAGASALGEP